MEISWVDLALAGVLLVSMFVGVARGLTYELLSLAGWIVAYFGCSYLAPVLLGFMPEGRFGQVPAQMGALVASFVIILVVWGIGARLVRLLIQATPLSLIDRLFGAVFGLVRGVLACMLLVLVLSMTPVSKSPTWQASSAVPWIETMLTDIHVVLPEGVTKVFS
ncbi:MAG: CvpA family protein [Paucibacter sp.]|nr:CvpA family protein [Roseateles sp.]